MKGSNYTEILDFNEIKVNEHKKNKKLFLLRTLPLLFMPILICLTIISTHSNKLIIIPINYVIYIILSLFLYLLILGFFTIKKSGSKKTKKKKIKKILFTLFMTAYIIGCASLIFLLYGPNDKFRTWFISTSMNTMSHQYICKWFYSDKEINKVIKGNYTKEVDEDTDTNLIDMKEETYSNEYEKQILKRDKDAEYKIIELEVNGQKAYLYRSF